MDQLPGGPVAGRKVKSPRRSALSNHHFTDEEPTVQSSAPSMYEFQIVASSRCLFGLITLKIISGSCLCFMDFALSARLPVPIQILSTDR